MNQIVGQRSTISEKWRYYGWCKLLHHFIEYCLDQLNNKHLKTAVNLIIQFFEIQYQKNYLVKVRSLFGPPAAKWGTVNFLWNWTKTIFSPWDRCQFLPKRNIFVNKHVIYKILQILRRLSKSMLIGLKVSTFVIKLHDSKLYY